MSLRSGPRPCGPRFTPAFAIERPRASIAFAWESVLAPTHRQAQSGQHDPAAYRGTTVAAPAMIMKYVRWPIRAEARRSSAAPIGQPLTCARPHAYWPRCVGLLRLWPRPSARRQDGSATNHRHEANGHHHADSAGRSHRTPRPQLRLEPVIAAIGNQAADEAEHLYDDDRNNGRPQPVP